jgi:predicted dehydrogenase
MPSTIPRRSFVQLGAASALSAAAYARVLGANERVGVGFIGYGLIGKRHVIDFMEQPDVDLVAVAETHRGRLQEAAGLMGEAVKMYDDFRHMLDNADVRAVVVSTPDHWHALMTMLACAAGKDVYVEKPLTLFVREGRWMVDIAHRTQRIVQVGTQQRSGAHYQQARELIGHGHLGRVFAVRAGSFRNIMPGFGSPPDQNPPPEMNWELALGPAPRRPFNLNRGIYHFRWFWDYSGGQMTNLGAHSLDVAYWYLGLKGPLAVSSAGGRFCLEDNGETPDSQDALFEYPGLTISWSHREASAGRLGSGGLEFFGPRGSMAVSRSGFEIVPDRKLVPANAVPQFAGAPPVGGPVRVQESDPPQYWTEARKDTSGSASQQFKLHVRNFLDCVKSRHQPVSDLESAHRVSTACHLANISLRLGRKIRWDPEREEILSDPEASQMLVRPYRKPWDAELRSLGVT